MNQNSDDNTLILAYQSGEQEALKILIERYTPLLFNFLARLTGRGNASDLVQETFIKVWKSLNRFNPEKASFKTWIFTIAKNTSTDFLRKHGLASGGKKFISFSDFGKDAEVDFAENISDTTILPDEALQKLYDAELLNSMLEKLPENYRAVLVLYYEEEMTFDEIGKVLKKSINTVKSQHRRAIEILRNNLS